MPSLAQVCIQAEKGIAASAAGVAVGAAAYLALDDLAADVALRAVGVAGESAGRRIPSAVRACWHAAAPAGDRAKRTRIAAAGEDAIEPGPHLAAWRGRSRRYAFEIGGRTIRFRAHLRALGGAVQVGEGVELVNEPLGMHPAQGMLADIELAGIIAEDDRIRQEIVRRHGAPQRAFGGDQDRVGT